MNTADFGLVKQASLTLLVENKADLIVKSSDKIKYFTDKPLLAEHGFSVLIDLESPGEKILWDAGGSKTALMQNIQRMEVDITSIKQIALSHGHWDHFRGMTEILANMQLLTEGKEWGSKITKQEVDTWLNNLRVPLIAHPAAFRERWWKKDDGSLAGPFLPPPIEEWKEAGARIILSVEPYQLAPGCWTTGYVPRNSFEHSGRSDQRRYRTGSEILPDDLDDDQAIVINVKKKGLVVLSGCAHSGIVNTVEQAKKISGVNRVHAVIGGFHLARAEEEEINQTIEYFLELKPELLVPGHCTGLKAISRFSREFPDQFVEGVVGTTYLF